jgi:hypothetical protein
MACVADAAGVMKPAVAGSEIAPRQPPRNRHRRSPIMLVAPLLLPAPSAPRRHVVGHCSVHALPRARRVPRSTPWAPLLVAIWLVLGCALLLCLPLARGGSAFGASAPFWLVAAPLIDLTWLARARLRRLLATPAALAFGAVRCVSPARLSRRRARPHAAAGRRCGAPVRAAR